MSLEMNYSISTIEQPSTKKSLKFRPFVVREEKHLLMAKESDKTQDVLLAIKNIVQSCCLEPNFNVDNITIFDLEYIFLQLRSISISNVQKFTSKDPDDNKEYNHIINLNDIKVVYPESQISNKIEVNKNITLLLKYPTCDLLDDRFLEEKLKKDGIYSIILNCIDKVFDKGNLIKLNIEEKENFLNNLTIPVFNKMEEYLKNSPKIEYKVFWKNSLGKEKAWVFKSLKDFFLFL
jgi:hypothetical protein